MIVSDNSHVINYIFPEITFICSYSSNVLLIPGPYLFGVGLVATLLSKEIWVIDHGFSEVIGFYGGIIVLTKTIGPKMSKWLQTKNDVSWKEDI